MFGISFEHLLIVGVILVLFGPKRLPELGKSLGLSIKNFKDSFNGNERDPKSGYLTENLENAQSEQEVKLLKLKIESLENEYHSLKEENLQLKSSGPVHFVAPTYTYSQDFARARGDDLKIKASSRLIAVGIEHYLENHWSSVKQFDQGILKDSIDGKEYRFVISEEGTEIGIKCRGFLNGAELFTLTVEQYPRYRCLSVDSFFGGDWEKVVAQMIQNYSNAAKERVKSWSQKEREEIEKKFKL